MTVQMSDKTRDSMYKKKSSPIQCQSLSHFQALYLIIIVISHLLLPLPLPLGLGLLDIVTMVFPFCSLCGMHVRPCDSGWASYGLDRLRFRTLVDIHSCIIEYGPEGSRNQELIF